MKYEFEKALRHGRLLIIVTLALMAVYVYLAFSGSFDTFSGISTDYFWKDEEYRQWMMSQETQLVDEAWIGDMKASYRDFVDENIMTPEEIEKYIAALKAEGVQTRGTAEEALANRYNLDYAFELLHPDAFHSREMGNAYIQAFKVYIPLAQDPVQYMHDKYERADNAWQQSAGMSSWEHMGYSDGQEADYWELIDAAYDDLKITVGYSLGWDMLCSVMQFLPYTLGMALIVTLGNLFSREQAEKMRPILRTTKYGRARLLRRKLGVAAVVASGLWLLFQLVMLIAVSLTYTLRGASCTAMCFSMEPSLYGLNWLCFYLINCAFSYLGTLVFALFAGCMSSLLPLRLSMPLNLVVTLLSGIPLNHFSYADQAFQMLDQLRAISPAQLMASHATLQVYQSYGFGNIMIQLPYMMAFAIVVETILLAGFLYRREGGK